MLYDRIQTKMFTVATKGFSTFWSILTAPPTDRPISPIEEAPKLVYISKSPDGSLSSRSSRCNSPSSVCLSPKQAILDFQNDLDRVKSKKSKPPKQRFKRFMSHLRSSNTGPCPYAQTDGCEPLAHHCTLCRREIPPTHFYASRPKKIQQDDTYISTRCCHQTVHSPCYRITLQYFIDSKGRPRCPICREYPDLFVACWSLGYVFDKDVGDIDDEECDCGESVSFTCDICQGRKQLLRDLHNLKVARPMVVRHRGSERSLRSLQKEVKLFTIIEVEED